jgi:hypothetical protein
MERVVRTLMYHLYHPPISQEALRWTLTINLIETGELEQRMQEECDRKRQPSWPPMTNKLHGECSCGNPARVQPVQPLGNTNTCV